MQRLLLFFIVLLLVALGFFLLLRPTPAPPVGDYGDAPDGEPAYPAPVGAPRLGEFPSLYASSNVRLAGNAGIVHLDADPPLRFGTGIDQEPDAEITDADTDDGAPTLVIGAFGTSGRLWFNASSPAGDPDVEQSGFVNVLLDLNQDGVWASHIDGGVPVEEWVVRNLAVSMPEGAFRRLVTPDFAFGPGSARTVLWGRFTLTSTPIDPAGFAALDGWDGSGPAAGHPQGETEDWFFPCEGSLNVAYPLTSDTFAQRLTMPTAAMVPPPQITVTNTASQAIVYVFAARAQVAVPFGAGYFFVDIDRANPEWNLQLVPVAPLPAGVAVNPTPVRPQPDQQFTITMPPGAAVTFDVVAAGNAASFPTVYDPTAPPQPGGADNRLALFYFHPLGPCLISLTKVNDEPVYLHWP